MSKKAEQRAIKDKKSLLPVIIILAILLLAGILYLGRDMFVSRDDKVAVVEEPLPRQEMVVPQEEPVPPPVSEPAEVAKPPAPVVKETPESACLKVSKQIEDFFRYLDGRDYIAAYKLRTNSLDHFNSMIKTAFSNPPIIVGETESLYSILNNTAHFYRVLKKQNVLLVKDVLHNEPGHIERMMGLFYTWSLVSQDCRNKGIKIELPLKNLYEYSAFFLNTLGGQAYLFRRDSTVRMLVKYYAILIIDRSNRESMNIYGIDIKPAIDSLLEEMSTADSLASKDEYISKLLVLQTAYETRYRGGRAEPAPEK